MAYATTVVITTKDRKQELRRALQSCFAQCPVPEVVVIDDGSADGTAEMVRQEFPAARVFRSEQSLGLIAQRNRGAELAQGDVIVSLDDDAALSAPDIVAVTMREFDHPRVGAVAIPWVYVRDGAQSEEFQRAPDSRGIYVCRHYAGLAHAIRRDLFRQLGGYREFLRYGGEEQDMGIRLLHAGYVVRLGSAKTVFHHESGVRNLARQKYHVARSAILLAWYTTPAAWLPQHLLGSIYHTLAYGLRHGHFWSRFRGVCSGLAGCTREWRMRGPVSTAAYRVSRLLVRRGALTLPEVARLMGWPEAGDECARLSGE